MAKRVIQAKARCGWNRLTAEDIVRFMQEFYPGWPDGHLREAIRHLLKNRVDLCVKIRFDKLSKCREESYKNFTSTKSYFEHVERESMFI